MVLTVSQLHHRVSQNWLLKRTTWTLQSPEKTRTKKEKKRRKRKLMNKEIR